MEASRYVTCLRHDAARLREAADGHLDLPVPTCPGWTVADLVRHVSRAYQHKVKCIQLGEFPKPWPPEPSGEDPIAEFDRSLAELLAEFDSHDPADFARTWYTPDQTVGFWIRRMALETVIHRVDAELAYRGVTAVPVDLALDGVDEVLTIMLGWVVAEDVREHGPEIVPGGLADADSRPLEIRAGERTWSVVITPSGAEVSTEPSTGTASSGTAMGDASAADGAARGADGAAATVTGDPVDLLLWLWRRGDDSRLTVDGDRALVDQLHRVMAAATQ